MGSTGDDDAFVYEGGFLAAERLRAEARRRGAPCLPRLEEVARRGTPVLRGAALEATFELDSTAGRALALAALERDADNEVRGTAAALLGACDDRASLDALLKALVGPSPLVREGATRGLGRRADDACAPALFEAWHQCRFGAPIGAAPRPPGPSAPARGVDLAKGFLSLLAGQFSDATVRAYFLRPFDAHDARALDDVVTVLGQSGDPAAEGPLFDVLERGPLELRAHAVRALCRPPLDRPAAERLAAALGRGFWPGDRLSWHVLSDIASALLDHDARWAFDALAPAVDARECRDPFGTGRAACILSTLEGLLCRASCEPDDDAPPPPPPDPRWRARCEALLDALEGPRREGQPYPVGYDGPEPIARRVVAGLCWFEEGRPERPPIAVELGDEGSTAFPLFIAGFHVDGPDDLFERLRAWRDRAPEGLYLFRHQFGGYACLQATLLGYALDPGPAFAESEAFRALQATLSDSHGQPLTWSARNEWGERLGLAPLMPIAQAWEALFLGTAGQPLAPLHGRPALAFRSVASPWNERASFWGPTPEVRPIGPFGPAHERALYEAGVAFGLGAPYLALVWENSD